MSQAFTDYLGFLLVRDVERYSRFNTENPCVGGSIPPLATSDIGSRQLLE